MECLLGSLLINCFSCVNDYLNINCMFGGCKQVLKVFVLFLLFVFGLKVFKFTLYLKGFDRYLSDFGDKTGAFQNGFCSKDDLELKCCSKISSGKCRLENLDKIHSSKCNLDDYCILKGDSDDDNAEKCDEDDAFDVLALRKLVKIERYRAKSVYLELEKERMASATAAEEAMAMILRLQNEKSLVEMEAKQYKRLSEEKQLHDQDVIRSLQWLVLKHESERSLLEDQLRLCLQKMRVQSNEEEKQGNFEESVCYSENAMENGLDPRFFSSLDMDLSME